MVFAKTLNLIKSEPRSVSSLVYRVNNDIQENGIRNYCF